MCQKVDAIWVTKVISFVRLVLLDRFMESSFAELDIPTVWVTSEFHTKTIKLCLEQYGLKSWN